MKAKKLIELNGKFYRILEQLKLNRYLVEEQFKPNQKFILKLYSPNDYKLEEV